MTPDHSSARPLLQDQTGHRLKKARQFIRMLEDELEETNRGLIALTMELEERASQLERAEEKYRTIFENAVEGMFRSAQDGRILVANHSLAQIFGYESAAAMVDAGTNLEEQFDVDADRRAELRRHLEEHGIVQAFQLRARRADGTEIWVEKHARLIRDRSGRVIGYEGSLQDVTERKKAVDSLRKTEQRYRLMIEGSEQVFFYAHDCEGRLEYVSPSITRILGYQLDELIGRSYETLLTEDIGNELVRRSTQNALKEGSGLQTYTALVRHKEGHDVPIELTESPVVRNGEVVGMQGFARDVTERTKAVRALQRSEEKLRHAQKLEALGQLAGGIAHDFNNLLNVIGGTADLVLGDLADDSPLQEDIGEIKRASKQAAGLTRQLLTFSRQQVLQPKILDLNAVITELEKMLARVLGEDVEVTLNLSQEPCVIFADPGQVEQVLLNLAVNARDAMARGGRLAIETAVLDGDAAAGFEPPEPVRRGRHCYLALRDTGTGIPRVVRDRIFDPFFTTKAVGKGTGLGLATVYGIIQQTNGQIWVESEEGEGATFHVLLPFAEDTPTAAVEAPSDLRMVQGRGTILVVEDEPALRSLTGRVLTRAGYRVIEAPHGEAALEQVSSHAGPVDLVVTDVVMPGMSGRELADRLEVDLPGVPVLYISGYMGDAMERNGIEEEKVAFLAKPFTPAALTDSVRGLLDVDPEDR